MESVGKNAATGSCFWRTIVHHRADRPLPTLFYTLNHRQRAYTLVNSYE